MDSIGHWMRAHDEWKRRALAAEQREAAARDLATYWEAGARLANENVDRVAEALAAAREQIAELERERARLTFIIHHTDLAEVGIQSPEQTDKSCIGTNTHKLKIAKQLAKLGIVTVEDSPQGPLVALAKPAALSSAHETIRALTDALDQLLDDMGEDGLCVCQAAKDMARAALTLAAKEPK